MQEIVVIDGEITLENVLDGEVELEAITDLDPEVVIGTGGAVYPHYSGSYTVTPSASVQTLDTSDKVMDDDVTIEAVQAGSATTPATIITANPTLSRSGRVVTATVSKTQQITPTVVEGYVSAGTAGNVGVSGSDTLTIPEGSATTPATTITSNPTVTVSSGGLITAKINKTQSITPTVVEGYVSAGTAGNVTASGYTDTQLTVQSAQTIHPSTSNQSIASGKYLTGALTFKAVTVSGLTADKVVQGNVVKIGDADDDDRIMSVTGTASGGITPTGTKTITANGTSIDVYSYQYADVAVPNSYSSSDEGKVVSNGALVAQTSDTVTANDTYDTTLINSLTVNVSGSGGYLYPAGSFFGDSSIHVTCKDGHLKVECLTARQSTYIRLYSLDASSSNNPSLNRPTVFTIPSGATCVLTYTNVVNSSNLRWNANFKQANSSTSLSYGIGENEHLNGETVTVTHTNAVDVGTLFVYVANMTVGSILEFDVSFTVNGTRYF